MSEKHMEAQLLLDRDMLIRIDERTQKLSENMTSVKSDITNLKNDVQGEIKELRIDINKNYVHKSEFLPVRKLVYGAVSLILSSFLATVIYLVYHFSQ